MCGIAGKATSDGRPVQRSLVERMCAMLEHRGPDSRGTHLDPGVGLGIQRLRVIDLETGDQPIYNEDRSIAVVLNGEIYNYRELRSRLQRQGHTLSTRGDTEVIAHLYEELGPACVSELHGMFAFALWDRRRRRLLVARDRVGKKPLFYSHTGGALSFASELRALLQDPEVPREIDHHALDRFLTYHWVPAPLSAFRGVRKLPAGSTLIYEDGRVRIDRYWRLRFDRKRSTASLTELHEELREQIRRAVRRRMIADVPLGVFLSGGIDSSTVVAAMAEASTEPVKTFSIGFEDEQWSELPNARLVAERFATDHHEFVIRPEATSILPRIVRHYGEPFADSSALPSFQVAEIARRQVTVALNGDGGDESFAGYNHYVSALRALRLTALPRGLRRLAGAAGERSRERGDPKRTANRVRRLARLIAADGGALYERHWWTFDSRQRDELYSDEFKRLVEGSPPPDVIESAWEAASGPAPLDRMQESDVNTFLPDDLLVKMDIASMSCSLEARSPFLDHELMQFAATLPASLKLRGDEKKVVLRDALRGWIPDQILDGPKRGFGLPMIGDWLRGDLREYLIEHLLDSRALSRGYFDEACVRSLVESHLSGAADHSFGLWTLLMLELWQREFIDDPRPALRLEPV